jgi:hypothetical protein
MAVTSGLRLRLTNKSLNKEIINWLETFFPLKKSLRIFKKTFLENPQDYDCVSRFVSEGLKFWY